MAKRKIIENIERAPHGAPRCEQVVCENKHLAAAFRHDMNIIVADGDDDDVKCY